MMRYQVVAKIEGGTDLSRRMVADDHADAAVLMMTGLELAPIMGRSGALVQRLAADIRLFHAQDDSGRPARVLVWEIAQ